MATPETLADWNKLLACCCEMPSCPLPLIECESKSGEATVNGYAPFVRPAGLDTDDLPEVYDTLTAFSGTRYSGTGWYYVSGPGTYPLSGEIKSVGVFNLSNIDGEPNTSTFTDTRNVHDEVADSCAAEPVGSSGLFGFIGPQDESELNYVSTDPVSECTETRIWEADVWTAQSGTEPFLQGCPGPFTDSESMSWDYEKQEVTYGQSLSDPVTKAELLVDAAADVPAGWTTPDGTFCTSSLVTDWPTIAEVGDWEPCNDPPFSVNVEATATAARFKLRVPNTHTGTWFLATWDLVFFPADGSTPEVVAADQTDEWTGPGTGDQDDPSWEFPGGWHEIPLPTEEGETRVVNLRYACYRGPYGYRPQTTGEGYDIPSP